MGTKPKEITLEAAIARLTEAARQEPSPVSITLGPIRLPAPAELWLMPPGTRLNVTQAAAAVGRTKSFIYHHVSRNGTCERIPHAKLDGAIVIEAGALRGWMERHEVH